MKTINTTCGAALDMIATLGIISTVKMPTLAAFAVNKALAILVAHPDVRAADGVRSASLTKHGTPTPDGAGIVLLPANRAAFLNEFTPVAFLVLSLELPTLPSVALERFLASDIEIEPTVLASISELWD
jgi:hypothetical protein